MAAPKSTAAKASINTSNDTVAEKMVSETAAAAEAIENKAADMFAIPAFGAANDQIRNFMETGLDQWRANVEKVQDLLAKNGSTLEGTMDTVIANAKALQVKSLDAAKANAESAMAFASELFKAKTLSDVIALQSSHARKTMETLMTQTREMSALAQKGAADAAARAKALMPAA